MTTRLFFVKYLCVLDFLINRQHDNKPFCHLHFQAEVPLDVCV